MKKMTECNRSFTKTLRHKKVRINGDALIIATPAPNICIAMHIAKSLGSGAFISLST
jgi:hypothetical protein